MVLLTMTDAMVNSLSYLRTHQIDKSKLDPDNLGPDLQHPAIGHQIAHFQVIALSKHLQTLSHTTQDVSVSYHLDDLLRGSRIHYEPVKSKAEPTNEFKALMARLRRDEEARAYERMINPPLATETFQQRFPNASNARLFSESQTEPSEADDVTYADINRQMAVIINILVSIVACSVALWLVASRWSTPSRLAFSMVGSILVAVAEAVVYAGYLRRVKEAREKGKKHIEIKEIIQTWVIGDNHSSSEQSELKLISKRPSNELIRRRNIQPG